MPHCLSIGVRLDDFWELNPRKLQPFLKADELRMQRKNQELWLQGRYFYEAMVVALNGALSKNSSGKYPEKPYDMNFHEEQSREENIEKAKAMFMQFAEGIKKKKGEQNG